MARLVSVNVGLPKDVAWQGKTVRTGIWKQPVPGPRLVRRLNIDGDGQGDLGGHGGENRAVLAYQTESYDYWQRFLGRDDLGYGVFGENFTIDGLPDDEVCIGDRFRIGEAEFEVTQPRVTCFRLGIRLGRPDMAALLVAHHRPGFYLRVLTEGHVRAGDEIVKSGSGPHEVSVTETDALLYLPGRDIDRVRRLLDVPALSPGWQQSFREIVDTAERGSETFTPDHGTEPAWAGFKDLRVVRVVPESSTVLSLHLAADDGSPLPAALPGQYLTLRVAGAGEPVPVRSYSLSSAPGARTYRISVKREPHGVVSGYLHTGLRPGAVLEAAAPRGDFVLDDGDGPVALVSAGIGVTPVTAMLHRLAAEHSERPVWWVHSARGPAEHALAVETHELLASLPHAHEHLFYSTDGGRLTAEKLGAIGIPAEATAYICGPAGFMDDMRDALTASGLTSVHTELFGTLATINPGITGHKTVAPHPPAGGPGSGPQITFARSGLAVPFDTGQSNLLDFADECDVPTRWSCRTGVCHMCATPLLSGEVTYAPDPLEPPSPGQVLLCCSRPSTDLVLDL